MQPLIFFRLGWADVSLVNLVHINKPMTIEELLSDFTQPFE